MGSPSTRISGSPGPADIYGPAPHIIIIGSGAHGGTLAYALAPTGKWILLLERGDYLPLTIMANALRVADHLCARLGVSRPRPTAQGSGKK